MNSFLVGFMGSGKTYWGRIWAKQSKLDFFDLDEVIEQQQGKSIASIFEMEGEAAFRELEAATLRSFEKKQNFILACGGGTACFNNNMQWMNQAGETVYLQAGVEEIFNRVLPEQAKRPLIAGLSQAALRVFIGQKLAEREAYYLQAKNILPVADLNENSVKTLKF